MTEYIVEVRNLGMYSESHEDKFVPSISMGIKYISKTFMDNNFIKVPKFVLKLENVNENNSNYLFNIADYILKNLKWRLDNVSILNNNNSISVPFSHDFVYSSFIRNIALRSYSFNNFYHIFASHLPSLNYTPTLDYTWAIILFRILNSSIGKITICLLIMYLISWLSGSNLFNFLEFLFYFFNNNIKLNKRKVSNTSSSFLLAILGNFSYAIFYIFYDFLSFKIYILDKPFRKKYLNIFFLKISYCFSITSAVLGSNGYWLYTLHSNFFQNYRAIWTIFSGLLSIVCYVLWFILASSPINLATFNIIINSIFRGVLEVIAFNSVAWNNYSLWNYYIASFNNETLCYSLAISLGITSHICFSYISIMLETKHVHALFFGIFNYISFTSIAFATNGIFFYVLKLSSIYKISLFIISYVGTILLNPLVYRWNNINHNTSIELTRLGNNTNYLNNTDNRNYTNRRAIAVMGYFFFVVCFVIATGLLFVETNIN